MLLPIVTIQFPEINLQTRDAHKLRGYFGNLFKDHSPLLHNHYENGQLRYGYPLVQYKVIGRIPTLVALNEGAELLTGLFLRIRELEINGQIFPVNTKNIKSEKIQTGYTDELTEYKFLTNWLALNQENYRKYLKLKEEEKKKMLNRIAVSNILSFFKGIGLFLESDQRLMANTRIEQKSSNLKDQKMMAFSGSFMVNAKLPDLIGIGKSVSRGYGTIKQC